MLGDTGRHVPDRSQAKDNYAAAVGDICILDRLPSGRQHVGQENEPVVGRTFGHLDGTELSLGNSEVLGLAAGYLTIELRVSEESGTRSELGDLGRLALGVETVPAHEAVPAGNRERDNHPITGLQVRHF